MQETRQQLLENFDEDIDDLPKLQLDQAEQRMDKISRWFWSVTKLKTSLPALTMISESRDGSRVY